MPFIKLISTIIQMTNSAQYPTQNDGTISISPKSTPSLVRRPIPPPRVISIIRANRRITHIARANQVPSDVTYIHHVVVEEQPEAVRLDDGDVVAAVGPGAAVDDHGHQVIQPVRGHHVIRLGGYRSQQSRHQVL